MPTISFYLLLKRVHMKNILFFFCLLANVVTLHGMRHSQIVPHHNENNNMSAKEIIKNDFKTYLSNRLKVHGKGSFTDDEIKDIENTYITMTNKTKFSFLSKCIHKDVVDDNGNNFVHSAVRHKDVKMIQWAMDIMEHPLSMPNENNKEPIDLCIDYLMPTANSNDRETECRIFAILVNGYAQADFDDDHRINFLKKLVALDFAYIKQGTQSIIEECILKNFSQEPDELSKIYQEMCDDKGNTFTHILVSRSMSDILYKFIEKGYITFAKNKQQEDPLILAQRNLSEVTCKLLQACTSGKDFTISAVSDEDKNKKCCYHMLQNFLKKQGNVDFKKCCDKHII